jgi:hypothetical protein
MRSEQFGIGDLARANAVDPAQSLLNPWWFVDVV